MNNDVIRPSGTNAPSPVTPTVGVQQERPIRHAQAADNKSIIQPRLLLYLSFKNLYYKKLRTVLTTTGVVIGVGAIVFLFSLGTGLENLVNKQVIGSSSVNSINVTSTTSKALKLTPDRVAQFKAIPSVVSVGRIYDAASNATIGTAQFESVLYGTDSTYLNLSAVNLVAGHLFGANDNDGALVGTTVLKAAGITSNEKAIGQQVNLKFDVTNTTTGAEEAINKDFKIVGVVQSSAGTEVYINSNVFEAAGRDDADQVEVSVNNKNNVSSVRQEIENSGFTTMSPLDTITQINEIFALLRFVFVGFGAIGVVIAILGMFNTLTISLLERTKEIALLISLGARERDVRRIFIIESLLLSVTGGLIGILAAFLLGGISDVVLTVFAHHRGATGTINAFAVTPILLFGTLLASVLLGYIVVYFPARRASRISPVEVQQLE